MTKNNKSDWWSDAWKILVISSLLLLIACATANEEVEADLSNPTETVEADEKWEDAVGTIDFSQNDLEEISWEAIHLSKTQ